MLLKKTKYRALLLIALILIAGCSTPAKFGGKKISFYESSKLWGLAPDRFGHCVNYQYPIRRLPAIGRSVFKMLKPIDALITQDENEQPDYVAVKVMLAEAEVGCDSCNAHELAQIYSLQAIVEYFLKNEPGAIEAYEKVIAQSPLIPISLELQTLYTLGQLYTVIEDYAVAESYFAKWESNCPSTTLRPEYFYTLAQINFVNHKLDAASDHINRAVAASLLNGSEVPASWKRLKLAIEIQMYGEPKSIDYMKELGYKLKDGSSNRAD